MINEIITKKQNRVFVLNKLIWLDKQLNGAVLASSTSEVTQWSTSTMRLWPARCLPQAAVIKPLLCLTLYTATLLQLLRFKRNLETVIK